jgi:integrase
MTDEPVLMNQVFDRYERDVLPTLGERTQKDYARHLKLLRKTFGHMAPDEIRPRDCGAFLDRPKGKIQANRQLAVLSAVFQKAVGRWYLADRNPCREVERNQIKKRTRYVTDNEFEAVYFIMPKRMQIAMDLALITGQRQGDLLSLRWAQIADGFIQFKQSKTGKKLAMAVSPSLQNILTRAKRLTPEFPHEYVLKTKTGARYTGEGFRAIWQRGMRKAMKGYRKKGKQYEPCLPERFTFHDLRAKNVSDTENIQEAFERAGHISMSMTRGIYDRGTRKVKPLL